MGKYWYIDNLGISFFMYSVCYFECYIFFIIDVDDLFEYVDVCEWFIINL